MNDRVVLVTGCSSGIGRALAQEFIRRGARVWVSARRIETILDFEGRAAGIVRLDVSDETGMADAVTRIERESGRLNVLVNNAGFGLMGPILDLAADDLRAQWETNITGPVRLTQFAARGMIARRSGMIVNIGSVSGILVSPFSGAYCASKAALHAVTDALRMELAPFGVRVVCVQPGGVESEFGRHASARVGARPASVSLYEPIRSFIDARANASQDRAMSAAEFAERLCDRLAKDPPPPVIRIGRNAGNYAAMGRFAPKRLLDRILAKKFGLSSLE
ncbi:MAG: SDR family NAD(P)-dependent oxidoreductase [Deltaproteobacteria bacterium]|nr:SDR family NAD(P)-dependent oxidoreductase [Deltaproteobacteria bacterium]